MNEEEVISELKLLVKPYHGIMHQGTFSNYIVRYRVGLLKPSTLNAFFMKMGYMKQDGKWQRKV